MAGQIFTPVPVAPTSVWNTEAKGSSAASLEKTASLRR
jgi:hypothetical protein